MTNSLLRPLLAMYRQILAKFVKITQGGLRVVSGWSQGGLRVVSEWSQGGLRVAELNMSISTVHSPKYHCVVSDGNQWLFDRFDHSGE